MILKVGRVATIYGQLRPPSDKSLTHRAYMLGAIATSPSTISSPLEGEDCESTLRCLGQMGLGASRDGSVVHLQPIQDWHAPRADLNCGNSGTTMRLLSGLIASRPISATLTGDESLSRRPMGRIAEPLTLMGARFEGTTAPIRIHGTNLKGINYSTPVASAQIKSAVLLAGLRAIGSTFVKEPILSRDHTERMLTALGIDILRDERGVGLAGEQNFQGFQFSVPADISSAAFWAVAAAVTPGSEVALTDVGVNPSRTGLLDVLTQAKVRFELSDQREELGEPIATLRIWGTDDLRAFRIDGELVPRLIDEIPVLAVLATQCQGVSEVRGAKELRVKESDRIQSVASGLRAMGATVETFDDGLAIEGPVRLKGTTIDSQGDHRIGMSFAIAGLIAEGTTMIENAEAIATSYPNFERDLWSLAVV